VNARHGGSRFDGHHIHAQCVRDGKSFVIEGLHLDPGLYLHEFGRHGLSRLGDAVPAPADIGAQTPNTDFRATEAAAALSTGASASPTTAAQPPLGDMTQPPARAEARSNAATEQPRSMLETATQAVNQQQPVQRSDDREALQANQHVRAQHIETGSEQACPSDTVDGQAALDGSIAATAADEVVLSAAADSIPPIASKIGHRRPTEVLRDRVRCGSNGACCSWPALLARAVFTLA